MKKVLLLVSVVAVALAGSALLATVGFADPTDHNPQKLPPPEVWGYVTDASAHAIRNAVVQIGGQTGLTVITGDDGRYDFVPAPMGDSVELFADALGCASSSRQLCIGPDYGANRVDIPLTAQVETGVVQNGDFTTVVGGKPAHWAATVPTVNIGVTAGVVGNAGYCESTGVGWGGWLSQAIPIIPDSVYTCYFKMKGDAGINEAFPMLAFRDANGNELKGWISAEPGFSDWIHTPSVDWMQYLHFKTYSGDPAQPFVRIAPPAGATFLSIWTGFGEVPAAGKRVYLDDVVVDRIGPAAPAITPLAKIAAVKNAAAGDLVSLSGPTTVTYAPNDGELRMTLFFYVAEAQGLGGLRIHDGGHFFPPVGATITGLTGHVRQTPGGEKYLEINSTPAFSSGTVIGPVGMNNKAAATDPKAPTNLVKVWGKVRNIVSHTVDDPPVTVIDSFTVDDGYNAPIAVNTIGIAVTDPDNFAGKTAVVTGILSKDDTGAWVILMANTPTAL